MLAAESALHALDGVSETELLEDGKLPEDETETLARWPIYSSVLEAALETALDLASDDAALDEVRADAARLYRDLLSELGHGPEEDGL